MAHADVVKNFNAAVNYDRFAGIQHRVGHDLIALCPDGADTILEFGCGSGAYTRLLCETFPYASIIAIDAAWRMVHESQMSIDHPDIGFVCADAETFDQGHYDLVTGNAVVHWFKNLEPGLKSLRDRLGDGGVLTFSYFGPETYRELREALSAAVGHSASLTVNDFATPDQLASILYRCFGDVSLQTRTLTEEFPTLRALLSNIKATGTRGRGVRPPVHWTAGLIETLESRYRREFGTIRVTYQVTLCRCGR